MHNKLLVTFLSGLFGSIFAWEVLYFSHSEGFVLGVSLAISCYFLFGWYMKAMAITHFFKENKLRLYLFLLPLIPIVLNFFILTTIASWDVIDAISYIFLYLFLGIAWLSVSLDGMLAFWSFSYEDDALINRNRAGLITLTAAIAAISLIYAGANIGDGPGWWTIVIAGGLGTVSWLLLGALINKATGILTRIIDRDLNSGIRFAGYLLSSGIILARASSGDWTSLAACFTDFTIGWPVLLLVCFVFLAEKFVFSRDESSTESVKIQKTTLSVTGGYIIYGILFVLLSPPIL